MDQWSGLQRAVAIQMFYMFEFLQFLLGFSKIPFFVSPCINEIHGSISKIPNIKSRQAALRGGI
jgi:hypothetical protein